MTLVVANVLSSPVLEKIVDKPKVVRKQTSTNAQLSHVPWHISSLEKKKGILPEIEQVGKLMRTISKWLASMLQQAILIVS